MLCVFLEHSPLRLWYYHNFALGRFYTKVYYKKKEWNAGISINQCDYVNVPNVNFSIFSFSCDCLVVGNFCEVRFVLTHFSKFQQNKCFIHGFNYDFVKIYNSSRWCV